MADPIYLRSTHIPETRVGSGQDAIVLPSPRDTLAAAL